MRALDTNESRTHVVLAGGKILKTVKVEYGGSVEEVNIRNSVLNAPRRVVQAGRSRTNGNRVSQASDLSTSQRDTFDIEDVAWSNGRYSHQIATAASSGKVILYDLQHPGVEVGRLHEHSRQVHKVDFCPIEGQLLLSASQDGTVRLWDLRTLRNVVKCESQGTFQGRNDGVRHTKWSPVSSATFALATDNGTVQKWDIRQNRAPTLRISAHMASCSSIDWHPDGRHLVSGGRDKDVKVWDLLGDRRQKPAYQLRAPQPIQNVRWRPPCYVSKGAGQLAKQCTYLATSYRTHPVVHIWDLRRPYNSFRELHHQFNNSTTDMLWQSTDLLWTVGPEGEFTQSDIRYLPKTLDRRPLSTFALSQQGDLVVFAQQRPSKHVIKADEESKPEVDGPSATKFSKSPKSVDAKQDTGAESLEDNFLSRSIPWHRRSRSESIKESKSLESTPPSYEDFGKPVTELDRTMQRRRSAVMKQHSYVGLLPGSALDTAFKMRARDWYTLKLDKKSMSMAQLIDAIDEVVSGYSNSASRAEHYLQSRVFEIFKTLLNEELEMGDKRYEKALSQVTHVLQRGSSPTGDQLSTPPSHRQSRPDAYYSIRSLATHGTKRIASGVITPLADPAPNAVGEKPREGTPPMDLICGTLNSSPERTRSSIPPAGSNDANTQPGGTQAAFHHQVTSSLLESSESSSSPHKGQMRLPQQPLRLGSSESLDTSKSTPSHIARRESSDSYPFFPSSFESARFKSAHGSFTNGIVQNPGLSLSNDATYGAAFPESPVTSKPQRADSVAMSMNKAASEKSQTEAITTSQHGSDREQEQDSPPAIEQDDEHFDDRLQQSQATIIDEKPEVDEFEDTETILNILKDLLEHHAQTGADAQTCTQLFICIAPLLAVFQAGRPREKINRLSMPFIESMLSTYHEQLVAMQLHIDAASLRKLCYPFFPAVYEQGEIGGDVAVACGICGNSVTYVGPGLKCEHCASTQQTCPFCWQLESPYSIPKPASEESSPVCKDPSFAFLLPSEHTGEDGVGDGPFSTLMAACPLCGHVLHMACAELWFGDPKNGGGCPVEDCDCGCVPGRQRENMEKREKQAMDRAAKEAKTMTEMAVRADSWEVRESEAVKRVAGGLRKI